MNNDIFEVMAVPFTMGTYPPTADACLAASEQKRIQKSSSILPGLRHERESISFALNGQNPVLDVNAVVTRGVNKAKECVA